MPVIVLARILHPLWLDCGGRLSRRPHAGRENTGAGARAAPPVGGRYAPAMSRDSVTELDALIAEATVDCYDEDEQVLGLYSVMVDELAVPFQTTVLGVAVTVEDLDLTGRGHIVARCSRGAIRQAILVLDLPLPTPPPPGAQWIEAYRRWAG
jgi:hypothetical protein